MPEYYVYISGVTIVEARNRRGAKEKIRQELRKAEEATSLHDDDLEILQGVPAA